MAGRGGSVAPREGNRVTSPSGDAQRLADAHAALRADPTVQFDLLPAPPPPEPPQWLKDLGEWLRSALEPVGRFVGWMNGFVPDAPYARILLWTVIAAAGLALVWLVVQRLRRGGWLLRARKRMAAEPLALEDDWRPDAAPAREWLRSADALAAQGRFADAVHHLLLRSVDDIARRRPAALSPSRTSRELALDPAIPAPARALFADIASRVEASLFGGRPMGADDWSAARGAYADFALPRAWRG